MAIILKSAEEIKKMRAAGKFAAEVLDFITPFVQPGVSTEELNQRCHDFMTQHGAIPATLNYKGYTKSSCISVNDVICHGIPSLEEILQKGDIVNIDVTPIVDGYHGDTSRMFCVGECSEEAMLLCERTKKAMLRGIEVIRPGIFLGEIGKAIQKYAEKFGYSVVRDFVGHGLGKKFHEDPQVLHYGDPKHKGPRLEAGMTFTVEPMINASENWGSVVEADGWTARTEDGALSAQWEHTVAVTEKGYEILTA